MKRRPSSLSALIRALARTFALSDPTNPQATVAALSHTSGVEGRWIGNLAARYEAQFAGLTRPRVKEIERFLREDTGLAEAHQRHAAKIHVKPLLQPPVMLPVAAAKDWDLPALPTSRDLAQWLGVTINELQWFANLKNLPGGEKLRHYRYVVLEKRQGEGKERLVESPKPRLKALQRRILTGILDRIPPHDAAHGFRKGRSIASFVMPHTAQPMVLRMDLRDFFPSISGPRVQALFRTCGYPEPVADLLGGICTNAVRGHRDPLYSRPHLPQGAPTSPAIANLCAFRVDCRLAGLARSAGILYTRYADDLAFSGEFRAERFPLHVAAIVMEEGFQVHHRKTRVMRASVRQHLAGLVVNEKPNVRRADFDELKAILTNCLRHGPASQNRESHSAFREHLAGRIGFVLSIHPGRGAKLQELFDRIAWT